MMGPQRLHLRNMLGHLIDHCKNMNEVKQVHAQLTRFTPRLSTFDCMFLISRLLFFTAISESGSLTYATRIFCLVSNPNLFMYNAMIRAYASKTENHARFNSLILYKRMLYEGIMPDFITLPFVLRESLKISDHLLGTSIHAHEVKFGLCSDVYVLNSLISFYTECGGLEDARKVFDEMSIKDDVSWNTMIIGCLRHGELDLAFQFFRKMKKKNVITWNSIITGFVQGARPKEALILFHEMQALGDNNEGDVVKPDKVTISSVLSACASLGVIDHGNLVHSYLRRSGLECDMVIGTALVDMYGKCGCIDNAVEAFREMPKKDVLAWTSMISAFALHGYGEEAFEVFREMEVNGIRPNSVTFVGLLSACAHSGLVEKGRWCFDVMKRVYGIQPQLQHYACLVDVLGRAGLFDEAEGVIRSMPVEPDVYVFGALLGGCQMHGNVELGEKVAKYLIEMEPQNHAFYVNLCDIYAKSGRLDAFKTVRAVMNDKGIKKTVQGCSTIEIDGVIQEFSASSNPEILMKDIICVLTALSSEMKTEGGDFSKYGDYSGTTPHI